MLQELTTGQVLQKEIELGVILERLMELDKEGGLFIARRVVARSFCVQRQAKSVHDITLILDMLHMLGPSDALLFENLESVELLGRPVADEHDLTEAALAQDFQHYEVFNVELLLLARGRLLRQLQGTGLRLPSL